MQDAREPSRFRHPPTAGHADLEARGLAEMPVVQEGPIRAARPHGQADRDARDHALSLGASGRGEVSGHSGAGDEAGEERRF